MIITVLKRRVCQRKPAGKSNENVRNHFHDLTSSQPIKRKILAANQSKPGYASDDDVYLKKLFKNKSFFSFQFHT